MKKHVGKIGLLVAAVLMLVVLTGCSGRGIEGSTWKYTEDVGSYCTFSFSNGTAVISSVNTITGEHQTDSVSYSVSGSKLTMDGQTFNWEIKGNTLILSVGGEKIVLYRV